MDSWYPYPESLYRFAPYVFVSMTSAPALIYSSCTSRINEGLLRFSSSKHLLIYVPRLYSSVPIPPSNRMTFPEFSRSRNGTLAMLLTPQTELDQIVHVNDA